ncbi:MAG: toll/interleukin-1 receptor domain-containing protein [Myxococcales bacterium]|nr:toll/interleukin-1 receptor domain-containing protein [Myxococcales bacterium]
MVSSSSIFISYSRIDSAAAKCVRQMLMALFPQAAVQLDTESVRGGLKWEHEIQALLESCQMVVLLWSRAANSSSWVEGECKMAAELGIPIVVLRLDTQAFASFVAPIQSVEIQDLQSRAPVIGLFGVPILGTLFSLIGLAQESATLASAGCIIATLGLALAAVAERQHHLHQLLGRAVSFPPNALRVASRAWARASTIIHMLCAFSAWVIWRHVLERT